MNFGKRICRGGTPIWVGHNAVAIGVGSSGSAALARAALVQRHSQGGKDPVSGSQRGECGTREWRNALAQIYERDAYAAVASEGADRTAQARRAWKRTDANGPGTDYCLRKN